MTQNLYVGKTTPAASVTVYWAGTTVKPTINVSDGGSAKSNPITAAADGSYSFWVDDGHYKIVNGATSGDITSIRFRQAGPEAFPHASEIAVSPFRSSTATTLEALLENLQNSPTLPGPLIVSDTTESTSSTTGSIKTAGGLGVAKAIYVGEVGNFAGQLVAAATTESTSSTTGSIKTAGGLGVAKALNVGSATASTSISTGSVVTAGGVGVAKALYVGENGNFAGQLVAAATTQSTTPLTGAFICSGGIGVAKDAYFASSLNLVSTNLASLGICQISEEITLSTSAVNTDSTANLLPANSLLLGVTGRVTTAITGGSNAVGTITMTGIAIADETFVIDSQTFTWKASRALAGEVTIGVSAAEAVTNIVTAVTADLATVTAADGTGDTVVVTAVAGGTGGNSIVFTEASTNMAVDGTGTLGGTSAGADTTTWAMADTATAARFASANSTLTTSGNSVGLNHWKGAVSTDAAGPTQASAAKLRITVDVPPDAGKVRATVFYIPLVAPTS